MSRRKRCQRRHGRHLQQYAHVDLEGFLRPGPNTIALAFSAPAAPPPTPASTASPKSPPTCAASSSS